MSTTVFETERLILRRWHEADREPFARLNADARVMRFFPKMLSRAESDLLIDKIDAHFKKHDFGMWAVELRTDHALAGFIGLNVPSFDAPFTPCVEIGWRMVPELWGQGLATEGASAVVRHAFESIGLAEIVAFTVPANHASRRVMEKLGMTNDPRDDFDHPQIPEGHPLRRHVLYRLRKQSV